MEEKIKQALGEQLLSIIAMQVRIEQLQKENDALKAAAASKDVPKE
jgi:cell shape-determining protein MreC